jgi:hypothetical protein
MNAYRDPVACKTYLPDHVKGDDNDVTAQALWAMITPAGYLQRLLDAFERYQVARWAPDQRTEAVLGALCESCLYAAVDDCTSSHIDWDLHVGTYWDNPAAPTRLMRVDLGLFDQGQDVTLLYGSLWQVRKSRTWFWEEQDPNQLSFWIDPPGLGYR